MPTRAHLPHLFLLVIIAAGLSLSLYLEQQQLPANAAPVLPTFSPPEGYYDQDILVTIQPPQPQTQLLFTLDGSTPTLTNAARYQRPIRLTRRFSQVTVISTRTIGPDNELGPVARATYFMTPSELPILSLTIDPADLWHPDTGLYTHFDERGPEWERPIEVTYLEPAINGHPRAVGFHVPAGVRIHGNNSRVYEKKSLRLYFRQEYGLNRLVYPLFPPLTSQPESTELKRLVLYAGGQEIAQPSWTLMRAHLMSSLAAQTNSYLAQTQPVLLFLNGESQGIYHLRHRIDEWFFADVYEMDVYSEGTQAARWQRLLHFIETHDLADPDHYAYVASQIDINNFIDYHILQFYAANTDWVATNVRQFLPHTQGGRWHWVFWDVDWIFGLAAWSSYDFDMLDWFYHNDRPGFDQGALPLRALLENESFRNQFLVRTADLLNTTLAPAAVTAEIDALAAALRPDIHYEIGRWSRPGSWEGNVAFMRQFAQHRASHMRQHIVNAFDLPGTTTVDIAPPATGKGQVALNGQVLPPTWSGTYFQDTTVTITAVPDPGYHFIGWESAVLPPTPTIQLPLQSDLTLTPRFAPTDPAAWRPGDVTFTRYQVDDMPPSPIAGDWFELLVTRPGGVDLRGWRLTDNDTKTAADEGSLLFANDDALAAIPRGTTLLIITSHTLPHDQHLAQDDVNPSDQQMVLYVGNDLLSSDADPGFQLSHDDNLVLLAPGPTTAWADDQGIAFLALHGAKAVTPFSFGVLQDGVTAVTP